MGWIIAILIMINIYLLFKLWSYYCGMAAITYHFVEKMKQPKPTDEEIKEATACVMKKILKF